MSSVQRCWLFGAVFFSAIFSTSVSAATCRVKIVTPPNGTVHSVSGVHTCEPGITCEIDLSTSDCEETFLASPNFGYTFSGWKNTSDSLCRNSAKACSIKSSIKKDFQPPPDTPDEQLIFHLEPVFVIDRSKEKPDKISLSCMVQECRATGLDIESRGSIDISTERCPALQGSEILMSGNPKQNTLFIENNALSDQYAGGSYSRLRNPESGWKFMGKIGKPATSKGITIVVQVNETQQLCSLEYVEAANTPHQVTLRISGPLKEL